MKEKADCYTLKVEEANTSEISVTCTPNFTTAISISIFNRNFEIGGHYYAYVFDYDLGLHLGLYRI
jgi:hypothetical protein